MLSLACASVDPCQRSGLSRGLLCRPSWRTSLGVRCRISTMQDAHIRNAGASTGVENTESSRRPIQISSLFEVVSSDLKRLNENLKSIVSVENPVLVSAAEQIFGAGGKRLRPALVFLVSRATAQMSGKNYYKTASLIAASLKSAAIFSGMNTSICEQMFEYGKNLGLSFQVVDDILDFTQTTEQLGKPVGSDLSQGNLTAPVIFALEKETKLRKIIDSEFSNTGSLETAIELIIQCGGLTRAQELAKQKADLALQNLQCLPESEFRKSLEGIVRYNIERID